MVYKWERSTYENALREGDKVLAIVSLIEPNETVRAIAWTSKGLVSEYGFMDLNQADQWVEDTIREDKP